ncbi:MAG: helix-turn-helix domain-containing protein [Bacteroidota bacterium]
MGFLIIASLTQLLLASLLLWQDFRNRRAESYLLLFLLLMTSHLIVKFVLLEVLDQEALFDNMVTSFSLGYGPLVFFYFQSKRRGILLRRRTHIFHFLPLVLCTIAYVLVSIKLASGYDEVLVNNYTRIVGLTVVASQVIYFSYLLVVLYRSKMDHTEVNWLKFPLWVALLPYLTLAVIALSSQNYRIIRMMAYGSMFIWVVAILRNYYKQKDISLPLESEDDLPSPTEKYQRSSLTENQAIAYLEKLQKLMSEQKLYLDPELSLGDLADRLDIPKHHLTEVLNTHLNKTFYQFVNTYRIEEAKRKIDMAEHDSLLELAFASGFKSKATFNTYFKQLTGATPSSYRKQSSTSSE